MPKLLSDGNPRWGHPYYGQALVDWADNVPPVVMSHLGPHERFSMELVFDALLNERRCVRAVNRDGRYPLLYIESHGVKRIYDLVELDIASEVYVARWVD